MIGRLRLWSDSLERLQNKVVVEGREDKVYWLETKSGTFFVKSFYSSLEVRRSMLFLVGIVWNVWVPRKMSFFA